MNEDVAQLLNALEAVTKQMAAPATWCSRDLRYLWANQAYADWIQRPLNEIVNNRILEVLGTDAFETLLPHFNRVLMGETVRYEQETNFQGIGPRWISATYTPTFDVNGATNGWVAVVLDISERKRAEEARFSHAAVIESSEDAIICKNLDAVITSWNGGAERLFGYTEAEVLGKPITILISPEFWEEEHQILERLRAGGRIEHHETTRVTKAGNRVDVSLTIGPVKDSAGRVVGFSKIAHDITKRKQAEKALQESEQRFRLVADTAPVMIWMSDTNKLCTYFNKPWLDFTGRFIEQELGNGWAEGVHLDDLQCCLDTYTQSFDRREKFRMEYRLRRHDGDYRWISDIGVPRYNQDRSFSGYIGSCIDITERKHAEEALSDMAQKLIEAQERERARIARELHDDINQRLAVLAIGISQLGNRYNGLPSELLDSMGQLQQMTSEISKGVHDLSHELHPSTLECLGLVAGMRSWCEEYGVRQKLKIDFKSGDVPTVPQETSLCLFRVLQEALHNAAKYSGVKRIDVRLSEKSGEIHLIVRDSGKGFDIEAAKRKQGLGLTSMRERVRLIGGTIVIDSKLLAGTTVHICVPVSANRRSAAG